MAVTTDQMYAVFQSIDASLKLLVAHFGCHQQTAATPAGRAIPRIAPDSDLDGQYGNPAIRAKAPRDWTGDEQLGKPMSECPPEYLDLVADRLDYFNSLETDEKKKKYQALDASRARGWAQRIRNGWNGHTVQPGEPAAFPSDAPAPIDDSEIAF